MEDRLRERAGDVHPQQLDLRVEVHANAVHLLLPLARLAAVALLPDEAVIPEPDKRARLVISVRPVFRGGRTWLVGPGGTSPFSTAERDPALIKALRKAHQYARKYGISPTASAGELRTAANPPDSYQRKIVRLAFLAPDLQDAILAGTLLPGVTLERLLSISFPVSWAKQRSLILAPEL